MNWRITGVALAALAAAGCDHPFAHGGMRGASPVTLVAAPATESEQAVIASATLHALLGEHASVHGLGEHAAAGSAQPRLPAGTWLEAQSVSLQALAQRSRSAWLAVDAAARNP